MVAALALSVPVLAALGSGPAQGRDVQLDLKRYCKAMNLDYLGLQQSERDGKWRPACGLWKVGFGPIRPVNVRYIDLGSACRRHHGTERWHSKGDKVWCEIPDAVTALKLCNRGPEKIWAAMTYWAGKATGRRRMGPSGWVSVGWYGIDPGTCNDPKINPSYQGDVYIYGYSRNVDYEGSDARFCIRTGKAFKFGTADEMACGTGGLKKVGMHRFRLRPRTNTWNFR